VVSPYGLRFARKEGDGVTRPPPEGVAMYYKCIVRLASHGRESKIFSGFFDKGILFSIKFL
jgi:hypothetical protein